MTLYWIDSNFQCSFVVDDQGKSIALVTPPGWLAQDAIGFSRRTDGVVYVAAERTPMLTAICDTAIDEWYHRTWDGGIGF
jgi:hypothetical protein